jgi:hypothetical protein
LEQVHNPQAVQLDTSTDLRLGLGDLDVPGPDELE